MTEAVIQKTTFSEAFKASEQYVPDDLMTTKRRERCLITASMFVPPLEDNEVIDDATVATGEIPIRLPIDHWNQLFLISSYLYKGVVIQLR